MRSISSSPSSPVSTFEKVLRAYGTGGFTYADVVAQLERLIAIGASPTAMLEILRRRERIEPFPEYAHVEVVRLLNAAIARDAAEAVASAEAHDPDNMRDQSSDSAGAPDGSVPHFATAAANQSASDFAVASALAADLAAARGLLELEQSRRRDSERALAERVASNDAVRLRAEEAARESKHYQTEFSALRDALAARDATIARVQNSLAERDAQLAALQQEHARIVPLLEARANAGTQSAADMPAARMPDAVALEQKAGKEAAALLGARLALSEFDVHAARGEMAAMRTASPFSLGVLRSWARNGGQGWNPRSITRLLMVSFAVVVLAVAAWFLAQRTAAPTQPSAPASAAVPAPGTGDAELASTGKAPAATLKRDSALCSVQANINACYDAIRRSPNDPALLVGLGDALLRAKRSQDAIRIYRRAAALAPGMPGLAAKITAAEQTLTSKQGSARPLGDRASGSAVTDKRYSNAAPEAQSH